MGLSSCVHQQMRTCVRACSFAWSLLASSPIEGGSHRLVDWTLISNSFPFDAFDTMSSDVMRHQCHRNFAHQYIIGWQSAAPEGTLRWWLGKGVAPSSVLEFQ